MSNIITRNNVQLNGSGTRAMMFAHGFGCDQNMWRFVEPAFRDRFRTVLFDHVGAGRSDLKAYDAAKYSSLHGYADDVIQIGRSGPGASQRSSDATSWPGSSETMVLGLYQRMVGTFDQSGGPSTLGWCQPACRHPSRPA